MVHQLFHQTASHATKISNVKDKEIFFKGYENQIITEKQ